MHLSATFASELKAKSVAVVSVVLLALASLVTPAPAQPSASEPDIQAILTSLQPLEAPGAMVMIQNGKVRKFAASGLADRRTRRPMRRDLPWRIASITKIVTGVVVLQLAREGRLKLDDPVAKHIKVSHPGMAKATIRQLLNHTSGIPDYFAHPESPLQISAAALVRDLRAPRDTSALLKMAVPVKHNEATGAEHDYSNTNYLLLGRVITALDGKTLPESFAARVFRPLALTGTGFPSSRGQFRQNAVRAYIPADGPQGPFSDMQNLLDVTEHTYFLGADGGLYSTADDLMRLLDAIWYGSLLTNLERDLLTADLVEDHDGSYRYGLGVAAYPTSCRTIVYGHEGRDLGSYSVALTDRATKRHLVLVLNRSADSMTGIDKVIADVRDAVFCARPAR
jgi:D-alanyl-D-alanine carboxypeptidase